jgi:hypothetical protein
MGGEFVVGSVPAVNTKQRFYKREKWITIGFTFTRVGTHDL